MSNNLSIVYQCKLCNSKVYQKNSYFADVNQAYKVLAEVLEGEASFEMPIQIIHECPPPSRAGYITVDFPTSYGIADLVGIHMQA